MSSVPDFLVAILLAVGLTAFIVGLDYLMRPRICRSCRRRCSACATVDTKKAVDTIIKRTKS